MGPILYSGTLPTPTRANAACQATGMRVGLGMPQETFSLWRLSRLRSPELFGYPRTDLPVTGVLGRPGVI